MVEIIADYNKISKVVTIFIGVDIVMLFPFCERRVNANETKV